MQLNFSTISEPSIAGAKWKGLFDKFWPGYQSWFLSNSTDFTPDLQTSEEALKKYMPKMWPTYVHLCNLTNADPVIARFLTGFQPPVYHSACAQAVIKTDEIQLVRNYDYDPKLLEGTLLLSKWNENKVMANADCLIGVIDGMNEAGLCVSLTFGGRQEVGYGFGIPFILRYVLEFCTHTAEAVKVLKSIPSHMSYNVTLVDKTGLAKTVMLAPDKPPLVSNDVFATNHQGTVEWHENAEFNQTVKRYNFIKNYLKTKDVSALELANAFLHPPLYNTNFKEGFGTLYTAVYQPENSMMKLLWPNLAIERSFDNFKEENILIQYKQTGQIVMPTVNLEAKPKPRNSSRWQDAVVNSLVSGIARKRSRQEQAKLRKRLMPEGKIAWQVLVDYWNNPEEF